jgi:integrase
LGKFSWWGRSSVTIYKDILCLLYRWSYDESCGCCLFTLQIWNGKGGKHRRVTLASELIEPLKNQITKAHFLYLQDIENKEYKGVWLPYALAQKHPNRHKDKEFNWHYLFPSNRLSTDPESNYLRCHHINEKNLQKSIKSTAKRVQMDKNVTCHTLRHSSFATHLSQHGYPAG